MTAAQTTPSFDTPCLVVDATTMHRNIVAMARTARGLGVRLRPHVKTHKSPWIARRQLDEGAHGVTVAKVAEAEVMVAHGVDDVFIAYPLVTEAKIRRALHLVGPASLCLGVDSVAGAEAVSACATACGTTVDVRMEIDTGYERTGVPAHAALDLAGHLARLPGIRLTGIFTFREATFSDGTPTRDVGGAGREEGAVMSALADSLRRAGVPVPDVSVGSTPTARHAGSVDGVTEIRPGAYVFNDREQHALGACGRDDIAASVRATVVSLPRPGVAVVDAGSKALSVDVRPGEPPLHLNGYAEVRGRPDVILDRLTEEHGMLRLAAGYDLGVGQQVELVPNHICTTVALHDHVTVVDGTDRPTRHEPIAARGKLT